MLHCKKVPGKHWGEIVGGAFPTGCCHLRGAGPTTNCSQSAASAREARDGEIRSRRRRCERRKGEARIFCERDFRRRSRSLAYRVTPLRGNKSKTPAPDREITTASLATVGINSTHTQKTDSRPAGTKKLRRWILIDLPMGEI